MTRQERKGWFLVGSLFVTLLLVFGSGYNTLPVFLPALYKGFGWDRAQVSMLATVLAASAGLSGLLVGWLIDRIEARFVMAAGVVLTGVSFLMASVSHSLGAMVCAYLLDGIGIAAGTVLPASLVLANWFSERRGLAMGIAISGTTFGGMVMTLAASYVIRHWGWRPAYGALAILMIVIAIPLVLLTVKSRPQGAQTKTVAQSADDLEGFETAAAFRTRSFWMIVLTQFCFAFAAAGVVIHLVAYLLGLGYGASVAALAVSLVFGCAACGKILMGLLADRVTGRFALGLNFAIQACGLSIGFSAGHGAILVVFVLIFGLTLGAPLMLIPLVIAESMGLRRYGAISGLTALAGTTGAALGPLVAGRVFDLTRSYTFAFELFIAIYIIGSIASFVCRSYAAERSLALRVAPTVQPAGR
ncbi:MAG: MFS transporter [Candidatus Binataceae bacterium]